MSWFLLVVAGLLEAGWAVGLEHCDGFRKPLPTLLTLGGAAASLWMLSLATRSIPAGTAYPLWVGFGAAGAVIAGVLMNGDALPPARVLFLTLLLSSVVGLKMTHA